MAQILWLKGTKLKKMIRSKNMTISDFANQLQISERTVYRWLQEECVNISAVEVKDIATLLNCAIEDLIFTDINNYIGNTDRNIDDLISSEVLNKLTFKNGTYISNIVLKSLYSMKDDQSDQISILSEIISIELKTIKIDAAASLLDRLREFDIKSSYLNTIISIYDSIISALKGDFNTSINILNSNDIQNTQSKELSTSVCLVYNLIKFLLQSLELDYSFLDESPHSFDISNANFKIIIEYMVVNGILATRNNNLIEAYRIFTNGYEFAKKNKLPLAIDVFKVHIFDLHICDKSIEDYGFEIDMIDTLLAENWYFSIESFSRIYYHFNMVNVAINRFTALIDRVSESPVTKAIIYKNISILYERSNMIPKAKEYMTLSNNLKQDFKIPIGRTK